MILRFEVLIETDDDEPMSLTTREEILSEMENVAQRKGGDLYESSWNVEE